MPSGHFAPCGSARATIPFRQSPGAAFPGGGRRRIGAQLLSHGHVRPAPGLSTGITEVLIPARTSLRAEDLHDPPARDAADPECEVKRQSAGRDRIHGHARTWIAHAHDGALAELPLDLRQRAFVSGRMMSARRIRLIRRQFPGSRPGR